MYVYVGGETSDVLMMAFCIHVLTATLGSVLIMEIMAQYRYSLLALYSSFIGFFFATFTTFLLFSGTEISKKILFSLSSILILSIFTQTVFRTLFEYLYYKLYATTGMDVLGNIFAEIQSDEISKLQQKEKELTQFT